MLLAVEHLSEIDADLCDLFEKDGAPVQWTRKPGFATLINIILEQQVSLASAKAINDKLHKSIIPFTPARFIKLGISTL